MSGRRRKGISPSLFPFLAVLICTLGTLILLLALVAENASTAAQAQADAAEVKTAIAAASPGEELGLSNDEANTLIGEGEFRVEQLVSFRDQQTADLEQRRSELTQVESHMKKIREQLKALNGEVELAMSDKDVEPVEDATLMTLRQELLKEEETVNKLRADKSNQLPRVALIPHKGPNGTDRRPVYLECTSQGLTIWPEGSEITITQLEESVTGANPLDDALRVIRFQAMHQYGDAVPPYPLLVVRPKGIVTYAAARTALRDWDDQFGYELVPAPVKLAYGKPDQQLKQRVDEVIRAAVIKQHGLTALAKRAGDRRRYTSDGQRSYPRLSAASMDRAGRESGFQDHREGFSRQNLRTMQQDAARGYGQYAAAGNGTDATAALDKKMNEAIGEIGNKSGQYPADQYAADQYTADQYTADQYTADQYGSGPYGSGPTGSGPTGSGTDGSGPNASGDYTQNPYAPNSTASDSILNQTFGDRASEGTQLGSNRFADSNQPSTQTRTGTGTGTGTEKTDLDPSQFGESPSTNDGDQDASESKYAGAKTNKYLVPSMGPDDSLGHQYNPHLSATMGLNSPTGSDSNYGSQSESGSQSRNGSQPQNSRSAQAANGSSSAAPGGSGGQASPDPRSSGGNPPAQGQASQSQQASQGQSSSQQQPQNQSATREMVRRQGANWALPSSFANRSGNSIVRTIRVKLYPDQLVLVGSARGGSLTEVFEIQGNGINQATIELASAVRDRVERWGAALPGGQWEPRLDVEVMPGANERFFQLKRLMAGGGVDVEGRLAQ